MFIVYANINEELVPLLCERIAQDKLVKDNVILYKVLGLQDSVYTSFEVSSISIKKENISYYLEGGIPSQPPEQKQIEQKGNDIPF